MHSSSTIKAYPLFLPFFPYNKIRAPDLQHSVQLAQYNKFLLLQEKSNLTFYFMNYTDVLNKLQANTHTSTTQQNLNPQRYVRCKCRCNYYIPWNLTAWSKSKNKTWQQFRCESNWYKLAYYNLFLYSLCYNQPNFCTFSITTNFKVGYSVMFRYKNLKVKVKFPLLMPWTHMGGVEVLLILTLSTAEGE